MSKDRNMRTAIFPLGTGSVSIAYCDGMNREDLTTLRGYLDLWLALLDEELVAPADKATNEGADE